MQICKDHAKDILDSDNVELTTIAITINNSKVLKLEATTQKRGWVVEPEKTAEVRYYPVHVRYSCVNSIDPFFLNIQWLSS